MGVFSSVAADLGSLTLTDSRVVPSCCIPCGVLGGRGCCTCSWWGAGCALHPQPPTILHTSPHTSTSPATLTPSPRACMSGPLTCLLASASRSLLRVPGTGRICHCCDGHWFLWLSVGSHLLAVYPNPTVPCLHSSQWPSCSWEWVKEGTGTASDGNEIADTCQNDHTVVQKVTATANHQMTCHLMRTGLQQGPWPGEVWPCWLQRPSTLELPTDSNKMVTGTHPDGEGHGTGPDPVAPKLWDLIDPTCPSLMTSRLWGPLSFFPSYVTLHMSHSIQRGLSLVITSLSPWVPQWPAHREGAAVPFSPPSLCSYLCSKISTKYLLPNPVVPWYSWLICSELLTSAESQEYRMVKHFVLQAASWLAQVLARARSRKQSSSAETFFFLIKMWHVQGLTSSEADE